MKKNLIFISLLFFTIGIYANVRLPRIFTDHAVLQRNAPVTIWGWADKGEKINVKFEKQILSVVADNDGKWQVKLKSMPAGGPYELKIKGKNVILLKDIMVGEVWLCSGQSNMAYSLGRDQKGAEPIPQEKCANIRQIKINETLSAEPTDDIVSKNGWQTYSPDVCREFSAVAYSFAKSLNTELNIPIGIINSSWGGTYIESWISQSALKKLPDYAGLSEISKSQLSDWNKKVNDLYAYYQQNLGIKTFENYVVNDSLWRSPLFDDSNWLTVPFPGNFDQNFLPLYDGNVWFRTVVDFNDANLSEGLTLNLGQIKDEYELYINGERINTSVNTYSIRKYELNPKKLLPGKNVIAIKVMNYWEAGGFMSSADEYSIEGKNGFKIQLAKQPWKMNFASALRVWLNNPNIHPGLVFNAMISPITSYTVKGTVWYQGENNENYAYQYRSLLPTLISDWRTRFKQGDFPFLFVQLPNFKKFVQNSQNGEATWAEMRDAFYNTQKNNNTAMAVTIDLGDSVDIHPVRKQEIGRRLSLLALNKVYNKELVCSGPEVESVTKSDGKIIVTFKKSASTLTANDRYGYLKGFEIAGENQRFYYAQATIVGNDVVLHCDSVQKPVAVRYSWSNNPDGNLYNSVGLPASPFRTDNWKLITEGNKFDSWIGNRYLINYKLP